jgi:N6-L-threonylcarbamoyladenine synthase
LSALADAGDGSALQFPRPMLTSPNLDFSFSGLKTAVVLAVRGTVPDESRKADIAAAFQEAVVDVLVAKSMKALDETGIGTLVVAGGVGANRRLRARLSSAAQAAGFRVHYPPLEYCTDNGAMIALAGALRLQRNAQTSARYGFTVKPRWDLASIG